MTNDERIFAHSLPNRPQSEWEVLPDHAEAVRCLAEEFAARFGFAGLAAAAAVLHDIGKASVEFQAYIREERPRGGDHSTWGARCAGALYRYPYGRILAYCIAGHHAGLCDRDDLLRRLDPRKTQIPDADRWRDHLVAPSADSLKPTTNFVIEDPGRRKPFAYAFLIRMIFSCLVDADFIATERIMSGGTVERGVVGDIDGFHDMLQAHLARLRVAASPSRLNDIRAEILDHALAKAKAAPGLFTLTVPTGGGKTLTSLAFALAHARAHKKRRVIYVIPFTAIIEQTAQVFRHVLGQDAVLEHHATFDWEEAQRRGDIDGGDERDGLGPLRRAAENWDAPIVVTTAVQFFESLFANRTSRCRKLHNIVDSVVVLDEAQTLPTRLLLPCLAALEELKSHYGVSVVFCTATQPAIRTCDRTLIDEHAKVDYGLDISDDQELAPRPREIYDELRRVRVEIRPGKTDDETIAARFAEQSQMLCIVNSRAHARDLFDRIKDLPGAVHLTTLMCPAHRREVLARLRGKLKARRPVRLVSTSLIEAGVDISFPEVWRASAGVDQIAQAAGRCNREGELRPDFGCVVVFEPADHKPPRSLQAFQQAAAGVLRDHAGDPLGLDAIAAYFRQLYFQQGGVKALDSARVGPPGDQLPGILEALGQSAHDMTFPFESVAEAFRMIEDTMVPVVVPWNDDAKAALESMEVAPRAPRDALRQLQQFTVGIPPKARDTWLALGAIRPVRREFGDALLRFEDTSLYQPQTGIDLSDPTYRSVESNMF